MSRGNNKNGNGLRRKVGDWKNIAKSRNNEPRNMRLVNPLGCAPKISEVGSAAYRRLVKR